MLVHASYWNSCEFSVTSNSTYLLGLLSVFLTLSVIEVAEEGVRERVELPLPRREPLPLGSGAGLVSGPGVSGGRLSLSPPPVGDTVTATDSPRPSFGTTWAGGLFHPRPPHGPRWCSASPSPLHPPSDRRNLSH